MLRGYANTSHGQVHYRTEGQGDPLFLLHATPRSGRIFERTVRLLAAKHRVFAIDTLGFGGSDPLPASVTMPQLAQMVVDCMDSLGLPKAHLLGYHTGNKIAAAVAANAPQRVDRLILVGMSHSLVVERSRREAAIHALVDDKLDQPGHAQAERLRQWAATFASVSETWWNAQALGKAAVTDEDLDELEREALDKIQARKSVDAIYRANFDFDFAQAVATCNHPTLVVELATQGEKHLKGSGSEVRDLMKNAELCVLEDTNRSVWEKEPAKIADAVLAFLSRRGH